MGFSETNVLRDMSGPSGGHACPRCGPGRIAANKCSQSMHLTSHAVMMNDMTPSLTPTSNQHQEDCHTTEENFKGPSVLVYESWTVCVKKSTFSPHLINILTIPSNCQLISSSSDKYFTHKFPIMQQYIFFPPSLKSTRPHLGNLRKPAPDVLLS